MDTGVVHHYISPWLAWQVVDYWFWCHIMGITVKCMAENPCWVNCQTFHASKYMLILPPCCKYAQTKLIFALFDLKILMVLLTGTQPTDLNMFTHRLVSPNPNLHGYSLPSIFGSHGYSLVWFYFSILAVMPSNWRVFSLLKEGLNLLKVQLVLEIYNIVGMCFIYFRRVFTILIWVSITFRCMEYKAQSTQTLPRMAKWVNLSLETTGMQRFRAMWLQVGTFCNMGDHVSVEYHQTLFRQFKHRTILVYLFSIQPPTLPPFLSVCVCSFLFSPCLTFLTDKNPDLYAQTHLHTQS